MSTAGKTTATGPGRSPGNPGRCRWTAWWCQAYDQYLIERANCLAAADCDFLLVNLFRAPLGGPIRLGAINELLAGLSRRAGLTAAIHPHMLRHSFATNLSAAGTALDEAQALLGHANPTSTQIYFHPSPERLRAAVDRVPGPGATP